MLFFKKQRLNKNTVRRIFMNQEGITKPVKTRNAKCRILTMVTYIVVIACLVLGFFLPVYPNDGQNVMLFMCLPDAINKIIVGFGGTAINAFSNLGWVQLAESSQVVNESISFYPLSMALIEYAFTLILALIFLVVIIICAIKRRNKSVKVLASIIEVVTVLIFAEYLSSLLSVADLTITLNTFPIVFILPLAGAVLALAVQTIAYNKGSGVIKLCAFLISSLTLLCFGSLAHYGFTADLGISSTFFGTSSLHSYVNNFNNVLAEGNGLSITISCFAYIILVLAYFNFIVDCIELTTTTKKWGRTLALIRYAFLLFVLIVFAVLAYIQTPNFGQFGILFDVVLALTIIHLLIAVIRYITTKKVYTMMANDAEGENLKDAATQLAIEQVNPEQRTVITLYPTQDGVPVEQQDAQAQPANGAPAYVSPFTNDTNNNYEQLTIESLDPYADTQPANGAPAQNAQPNGAPAQNAPEQQATYANPQQPYYGQPQQAPYPYTEQPVYGTQPVYTDADTQPVYTQPAPKKKYPSDKFIDTLTDTEKAEFSRLFLDDDLTYDNIPVYVVQGDNEAFFSSIFLYLGKFRTILSDGLINKIYLQLNLLH
jgi:hypothetical protein